MEKVLSRILSDLQKNKLSHAILIDGGTPSEREETARKAAQAMVCSGDVRPCGVCADCIKAAANAHADILVYTGANAPGSFKVDIVREIRRNAAVLPNEAAVKVFLLIGCETMLAGAQNALLKILEEPPQYVRFVLTCNTSSVLLDTILSRVTLYSLSENTDVEEEWQAEADEKAGDFLSLIAAGDEAAVLRATVDYEKDKTALRNMCRSLYTKSAKVLLCKEADAPFDPFISDLASRLSDQKLMQIMDTAAITVQAVQGNINGNLLSAFFCARLFADQKERI